MARARSVRSVRRALQRTPRSAAHCASRQLGRPSFAQRLRHGGTPLMAATISPHVHVEPGDGGLLTLSMGPQHPSTHGVLRLILEMDGEIVVKIRPEIGYLHTGIEKMAEAKTYHQAITRTDRIDYLCPMTNNLAFVLATEKLLELEPPPRALYLRVLLNELTRLNSHLVWLGTHAMDLGAVTMVLYCFREREEILKLFETVSGQRMMTSYFR